MGVWRDYFHFQDSNQWPNDHEQKERIKSAIDNIRTHIDKNISNLTSSENEKALKKWQWLKKEFESEQGKEIWQKFWIEE